MALSSLKTFGCVALFVFFSLSPHSDATLRDEGYTLYGEQGRPVTNSRIVEIELVQRSSSGDSNRFTIRYVTTEADLKHPDCVYYNGACLSDIPVSLSPESSDRWEVTFEVPRTFKEAVIGFEVLHREMYIVVNNDGIDAVSQIDGLGHNWPKMILNPVHEVVYNPGEDVEVMVNFGPHRPSSLIEGDWVPFIMVPILYDLNEERIIQGPMELVQQSPLHESEGGRSGYAYKYTFDTSSKLLGGCINIFSEFDLTGPLVKEIGFSKVLPLRPAYQSEPFKPGFIHIVDDNDLPYNVGIDEHSECK
ncbi:hypothetical protein PoB_003696500 [Plakobranchus ocellatus]|uniref:Uncharacterized protein n=1 Tax=Plakobranchus ocellatus TaxID=259542 RepID=A0AAV4AT15_9GAST|nr:hypothetical protein PoB_003696500 [Plakobranchus ocellatus]